MIDVENFPHTSGGIENKRNEQNNLFMYKSVITVRNKMKCKKMCYYCLRIVYVEEERNKLFIVSPRKNPPPKNTAHTPFMQDNKA